MAELNSERDRGFRIIALIVSFGLFMQNLDTTVLATALPTMAQAFAVPPGEIAGALTAYLLALAIFVPASGSVAENFGARRVFQAAIAIFTAGSIACGLSSGLISLFAARFLQGIGGAMMVPVGRLVLLRSVRREDMVSAVSWLTMPGLIGPLLGPPVGGFFVTYFDWRWIFWINVPVGVIGVVMVQALIPVIAPGPRRPFDLRGFAISALALSATIFGFQLAAHPGGWTLGALLLAGGALGAGGYVIHTRRAAHAILDLSLFRVPTFRLSLIGGTLLRISQGAQPFLLPMLLQFVLGFTAAKSGLMSAAAPLGAIFMKVLARPILRLCGFRRTLVIMGVAVSLGFAMTGLIRPDWSFGAICALLLVLGFATSLQFTGYNALAYDLIEPQQMSGATTLYATFQQVSLSLGVCVASAVLSAAMWHSGHVVPTAGDFSISIWVVAAISLTAIFPNLAFAADAGQGLVRPARRDP